MKKFFALSLLFCAAVTGASAEDSFTWKNSSTAISAATWTVADNWTLSGSTTFPTDGPAITGDHAWDKMYFTNASGTTPNLEGWAFKIEMDNSAITIPNIKKLQGTCSITLKNGSTLNMTKAVADSGNDGHPVAIDLATGDNNVFNLIMGNNKGGDLTTVNYGTVTATTNRKFNISSNNTTARTYNLLKVVATITDEVESTTEPTLHSVNLGTLENVTISESLTSEIAAQGYVQHANGALTATEGNVGFYSVDASNGKIMLYWVTGQAAGEDIVVENGVSASLTELAAEHGIPNSITVKSGGTLDIDGDYNLNKVTTEDGATLILSTAADITAITGATNVVVNADCTINGNKSTVATGQLTINAGKQLTIGGGDGQTNSVASFTSVLVNGTIYGNNGTTTLNNVTFGNDGVLHSFDMGGAGSAAANGTYDNSFHLTGTTTVNGEAYILSYWNAQYTIDKLAGSGTLKFRGNGKNNEGAAEATYYTISDTEEFTGSFDILNTNARFANVLEGIKVTNGIKVNTISLKDITLVGSQRLNTQGTITIDGVVANDLTSSSYGYALVQGGSTTLNLKGDIDFTLNSNGETNSHSKLGYQTASTINILEGANVKCSGLWHSSNTDCAPINIAANATLVSTDKVWSNSIANNGHIKIEANSLGTDAYINSATITGDNFDVILTEAALNALAVADYTVVSCSGDNAATNVTVNGESDFTVATKPFVVVKDGNNVKLICLAALQKNIDDAMTAISADKVGYPDRENTNNTAISELMQYMTNQVLGSPIRATNYTEAIAAYEAVCNLTAIRLPVDGKAYTIKAVYSGGEDMLYYDEEAGKIKGAVAPTKGNIFVCKKTGEGKFLLVNEYGKYLTWGSSNDITSNASAVVDEYSKYADVTIAKATARTNGGGADVASEGRFGLVTLQAFRANTETLWYSNYIHGHATNNFVEDYATSKWYDGAGNRTHMYRIEEVDNPNNIKLTKPESSFEGGLNGKYVGTFSAPYAVELPEGVVAYTANMNGDNVTFEELGNVVPKNTGVVLYAAEANAAITEKAVPATENVTVEGTNLLVGTNGAAVTVDAGVNAYIMAYNEAEGVKFFKLADNDRTIARNKAYLDLTGANSNLLNFRFEFEDTLTGVEHIETSDVNAPVFDLQGRRVQNVQSGLYIVNGKKVIR